MQEYRAAAAGDAGRAVVIDLDDEIIVAVGAPPQSPWPERAFWRPAIAFALVDPDAAAPERDRHGLPAGGQPALARIAGGGANPDRGKRPVTQGCLISV